MNATEAYQLLQKRYAPPSYVLLDEVRDGTGYSTAGRSMDALAFGLWPSRGLEIIGFEIKVSRTDWLRELLKPEKAEAFWKYLDRWYVVAPEDIVRAGELPKGWGLLEAKGDKLKVSVESVGKKAAPINRHFFMSIMRNFDKRYVTRSFANEKIDIAVEEKLKDRRLSEKWESERLRGELEALRKAVGDFEETSGIKIGERWDYPREMGAAVKLVKEHGVEKVRQEMTYTMNSLRSIANSIEKGLTPQ